MKMILIALFLISLLIFNDSTKIDCQYGINVYWAADIIYECECKNAININSPENAQIEAVTGRHSGIKTNNDEIYFLVYEKVVNYFPKGLEKIFPNLVGFYLEKTNLKGIQQSDIKSYSYLTYLALLNQDIQLLENDLFDFNPNLKHIRFDYCKIVHIGLKVFDNLSNLVSLRLAGNACIQNYSKENDRIDVSRVINSLKSKCKDSVFLKIDEKMKKIFDNLDSHCIANSEKFKANVENLESEVKSSKFSNNSVLNQRIDQFKKTSIPLSDWQLQNTAMLKNFSISINSLNSMIYKNDQTNKLRHFQYETLYDLQLQNTEMLKNLNTSKIHANDQTKMNSRLMLFMTCVISLIHIIALILIIKCYS